MPGAPTVDVPNPLDGVGSLMGGQLVTAVTDLLRAFTQDFLSQLAAPVATYVLRTPDVLGEPSLRSSWLIAVAALVACAGLLVALAGLAIIPGDTRLGHSARHAVGTRLPACLLTATISLPKGSPKPATEAAAMALPQVQRAIEGRPVKKVIIVPNKIVNVVV